VEVTTYRLFTWEGTLCRLLAEGMLVNMGAESETDIDVKMSAFDESGHELGSGYGSSWLEPLESGETGPFSAATSQFDCDATVAAVEFDITSQATTQRRYRDLEPTGMVVRESDGQATLFGELVNTGPSYLNAGDADSRIYVGFFRGEVLVDLAAAKRPTVNTPGPVGQPHPPGFRLPWSAVVPEAEYDRWTVWPIATEYPAGVWPVALGVRELQIESDGGAVKVGGTLYNCGSLEALDVLLMLVGRGQDNLLSGFDLHVVQTRDPIPPGDEIRFSARWGSVGSDTDPRLIEVHPFSLQSQPVSPGLVPCSRLVGRLALPALRYDAPTAIR
jgi:hypothetical protein